MTGLITKILDWTGGFFLRKRRHTGHLRLLRAEINQAIDRANEYETGPKAPAWRCVTEAYDGLFADLVGDGIFDADAIATIKGAYADMVDFNRCLQQIQDAGERQKFLEIPRAILKSENVGKSAPEALAAIDERLN